MSTIATASSEYRTVTEACGLLDRSERGKLALSGSEAKAFLQGQVTNDVEGLIPGGGCYAAFLTPKGKMLGDLRLLDAGLQPVAPSASGLVEPGDAEVVPLLLLDTERISLQELFNMIRRFSIGYDLELHKRTLECGLLSLIGPDAPALAGVPQLAAAEEHAHQPAALHGVRARAIRTDVGIDLLCDAEDTPALHAAMERAGAAAVSSETAECLRIERGRPRYGIDLDETVIPQEAGLNARAVSFTKGCYVGQETVARLHYRGKPNRHLRGLRCAAPVRTGEELSFEGRSVGRVASVARSPRLGVIALALVRREAPPGSTLSVGDGALSAEVVELPFS